MTPRFDDYEKKIRSLPADPADSDILRPRFLLAREGTLEAFYAPLHGVTAEADLVIVGLSPGMSQTLLAFREARKLLRDGEKAPDIFNEIRRRIAFAGTMRRNLVTMLDEIGVARRLELPSTAALFDHASGRLHSTSAFRYPVFKNRKNYSGSPKVENSALLSTLARTNLPAELELLPDAVVVPLGRAVEATLAHLRLDRGHNVLWGFPHPSGGNGHRIAQFKSEYDRLRKAVRKW